MASSVTPAPRATWIWAVVILLWPVALLNYLDRQILAVMKTSMFGDLVGLTSNEQWGIVLGSFKWVYALLSPLAGFVGDRTSRRHVIVISLFVWSAATWATGAVHSYHELLLARVLMGVSEAFYIPTALALIAEFHRGPTRSLAIGLHQTAIYAGTILGGFAGHLADMPHWGWRSAFSTCGIVGILYAIPLFTLLQDSPTTDEATRDAQPKPSPGELFTNRNFLLMVLYFTLPALAGWVIRDWMPDVLKKQFHLSQGKAGVSAVLYVQLASLVGAACGGWLADRWMRRTVRGRIYISAIGMTLFLPALFGVGNAQTLTIAIACLMIFGIGWGFFDCNNMPILCQIVRPELRATGYGLMNLVSISCGGFADVAFGQLRDRQVPLNVIFGVFAGFALVSVVIVLLIKPQPSVETSST